MADYPKSNPVSAGEPTEADQYNFLRQDAIFLTGDPETDGTIYDLMRAKIPVEITQTAVDSISVAGPLAYLIQDSICKTDDDLSVTIDDAFFITAARLYIYVIGDSGVLTLNVSATVPTSEKAKVIGSLLWDGSKIVPGTITAQIENVSPSINQARLTLVSGDPLGLDDVTGGTVYFTPYHGNQIALLAGGQWALFTLTEISLELTGLTAGTVCDLFVYADGTGINMDKVEWGTNGPRPSGLLAIRDGVYVLAADNRKKYIGSVAITENAKTSDRKNARCLWNEYNRVAKILSADFEPVEAEYYATVNAWGPYGGEDCPEVKVLIGKADGTMDLIGYGSTVYQSAADASAGRYAILGIGRDLVKVSPFTGNTADAGSVPSYGLMPSAITLQTNQTGFYRYGLCVYGNYPFELIQDDLGSGGIIGLRGKIEV